MKLRKWFGVVAMVVAGIAAILLHDAWVVVTSGPVGVQVSKDAVIHGAYFGVSALLPLALVFVAGLALLLIPVSKE